MFTLCDCNNITNSYVAHCEQKPNRSRNQKKIAQCKRALRKKSKISELRVQKLKLDKQIIFRWGIQIKVPGNFFFPLDQ